MKKYSRKKLISFFSKMPPRSKPLFGENKCPIEFFGYHPKVDWPLANAIDDYAHDKLDQSWGRALTAGRIVKIAKGLK